MSIPKADNIDIYIYYIKPFIVQLDEVSMTMYFQMEAVITVRDDGNTPLSSSIFVTLHVIDVDERQLVQVTSAATTYISTEIPFNTNQGQVRVWVSGRGYYVTQTSHEEIQYNTALLPSVNEIARGMFCGAKYTHHTFTPIIKHN